MFETWDWDWLDIKTHPLSVGANDSQQLDKLLAPPSLPPKPTPSTPKSVSLHDKRIYVGNLYVPAGSSLEQKQKNAHSRPPAREMTFDFGASGCLLPLLPSNEYE